MSSRAGLDLECVQNPSLSPSGRNEGSQERRERRRSTRRYEDAPEEQAWSIDDRRRTVRFLPPWSSGIALTSRSAFMQIMAWVDGELQDTQLEDSEDLN